MKEITLEQEFTQFKALHKYSVLKAKMIAYYETLEETTVTLPHFFGGNTPEELADRDLQHLIKTDKDRFNRLYELAWNEIAEQMQ